jgi:hypothetical protein
MSALGPASFVLTLGLIAITVWAAYRNWQASGWGSDAAAWVQAAGSIAAIAGAAWLARGEDARARRMLRRHNEETAWFVRFILVQAQTEAHVIAHELVNRIGPFGDLDARSWQQRARTSALNLDAFVGSVEHVHPSVVHVISNAKVLADDLLTDVRELHLDLKADRWPSEDLVARIIEPHHALLQLIEVFDDRMCRVSDALDEGGDMLPHGSWQEYSEGRRKNEPA